MTSRGWIPVTPSAPCKACGKPDWCARSQDWSHSICRRGGDGLGMSKIDRSGAEYWPFRSKDSFRPTPILPPRPRNTRRADDRELDRVYSFILGHLGLESRHRENLLGRGLTSTEIELRGYRSLPARGRTTLARKVIEYFGPALCSEIPGLIQKGEVQNKWWTLAGMAGLVIPVRNTKGQIVALKTRIETGIAKSGGKYLYLSSAKVGGPGPGAPVHIPTYLGTSRDEIRVTEGELKADIASVLTGIHTISVPGVAACRRAIPILKLLGAAVVNVAFDMDASENWHVANALRIFTRALKAEGFRYRIETWGAT